jgi:hypothetical protein
MEPIDIDNPTAAIQPQHEDVAGQRMTRIYGDHANMLRLQNAYRPNVGGKYNIDRIYRKRAEYELRQLQNAMFKERTLYCKENNITFMDFQNQVTEDPTIMENLYARAILKIPKTCRTILGNSYK